MSKYKIIVLTSGKSRGSNFVAMENYFFKKNIPVVIEKVIVTSKKAPIIQKCKLLGVTYQYIPCKDIDVYQEQLLEFLSDNKVHLIVLAGFMKLLTSDFISQVKLPILNIHPALLPKFGGKGMYGMKVHNAVYISKERYSGITIHQVNEQYDEGNIVFQHRLRIHRSKTPEIIAHKVLKLEHKYYGRVIYKFLKDYYE